MVVVGSWKWCHGIVACGGCIMLAVHVFVCGSQCWQLCTCALACLWQDSDTLSPFVSPYVNVEVSGGDGALVRKLAFSGECASG